jgi:DNA topoisomerase-2
MSDLKSCVSSATFASKSVSEKYQKKSHLEHIRDLPDTYIGSIEPITQPMWVYNEESSTMEQQDITYIPGLFKIFDEVLVNANDHKIRCPELKNIKVNIDTESGKISVWNDGSGIDVEIHEESGVYAPELIFGHLLTSANYDQSEKKLTGGKNGYGAKLANIFSTWFYVETVDDTRGKKYCQEFTNNMRTVGKPKITSSKAKPYVLVEFIPDFSRFKVDRLTDDIIKVFKKRVYDLSATVQDVSIYLNDKKLPIKNFEKYIELYIGSNKKEVPRVFETVNDRWEIGACTSPSGSFQHISFVNGIWTYKGGKHVDYVAGNLSRRVTKYINEKKKKLNVKENYVRENIWIFVRCLIENPSFSSQTKEELTTISSKFGSKCEVSDEFIEKLAKSGVMDKAIELTAFKEKDSLKKTDGKKRFTLADIPKLDDANKAGGSESHKCTLILTEGDSAKASAVSGLAVVGRDYYGVFPLKGKLLNVREATHTQLTNNEEITQIKKILGLQHYEKGSTKAKEYSDIKDLRYGRILIMTDADVDGSHIKGLLMNFFHYHWPSLLKIPNFIDTLKTPLVKASKGSFSKQSKTNKGGLIFYSLNEYESWKKETPNSHTWEIKYYKGLGTSTSEEFKDYFREMAKNLVHYTWCDDELDKDAITLAFQKDRADDRKKWLNEYNADPDHEKREIISSNPSYSDFIHNELIHFSNYDNIRSIPNMLDGLKPSQRKVLFACFKRNLKKEIKVAQLSGYVSEQTSYHHGEVSLQKTIIGMAQNFVGSNNVNLLVPNGQFGTRIKGGDDAASPRYIFTHLNDITFRLFDANDFPILKYLEDDGDKIEPEKYIPILPTVLVNGTDGIGTGFRSKIPCFNPMDIYKQIRNRLEAQLAGEDFYAFEPIHPWYNKFDGTIELVDGSSGNVNDDESVASSEYGDFRKYISKGRYSIQGDNIRITELPIGSWTQDYKEFIENAILENSETDKEEKKKKKKSDESSEDSSVKTGKSVKIKAPKKKYNLPIISYDNYSTDEKVSFLIKLEKGFIQSLSDEDIMKRFKLTKILNTSSMYLYNDNGEIQHYKTPEEIMEDFYNIRLEYYQKRKDYLLQKLLRECIVLENKVKFVESVLADKIKWNIPEEELEVILAELGLNMLNLDEFDLGIDFTTRVPKDGSKVNFNYLLEMKIRSLTKEKVVSLKKEYEEKRVEYDILEKKPIAGLWIEDMNILKDILETFVIESKVKEDTDSITNLAKKTKKVKEIILEEEVVAKPKPQKVLKKVSKEVQNEVSNEEPKAPPKKKIIIKKPKSVDSFFVDSTQVSKEEVSKEEIKILPKPKKKILIKKVDSLAS